MRVTVRLHSILRHREGATIDRLELQLAEGTRVQAVLERLAIPPQLDVVLAIDGALVEADAALHDGDTLALIPAISGGVANP